MEIHIIAHPIIAMSQFNTLATYKANVQVLNKNMCKYTIYLYKYGPKPWNNIDLSDKPVQNMIRHLSMKEDTAFRIGKETINRLYNFIDSYGLHFIPQENKIYTRARKP